MMKSGDKKRTKLPCAKIGGQNDEMYSTSMAEKGQQESLPLPQPCEGASAGHGALPRCHEAARPMSRGEEAEDDECASARYDGPKGAMTVRPINSV